MRISVSPPATGTIAIRLISAAQRQSGTPTFFQVFRLLLRPIGSPTRKYLKATRPSPAGSRSSHLRQRSLPCCQSQTSILTILYSASQDGQLNGIGSDLLIVRKGTGLLRWYSAKPSKTRVTIGRKSPWRRLLLPIRFPGVSVEQSATTPLNLPLCCRGCPLHPSTS